MITKLNLPKKLIYQKDGYTFLKLKGKKNFVLFLEYIKKELLKIVKSITDKNNYILLHSGDKIIKKNFTNDRQLWMEELNDQACWSLAQFNWKYFKTTSYQLTSDLNLSLLPDNLFYFNILEFDNKFKDKIVNEKGHFKAAYSINYLNNKVVGRTNYKGKIISCPLDYFINDKNIPDAIITNSKFFFKHIKKIHYISLENQYNKLDSIDGLELEKTYITLCNKVDVKFKGWRNFNKLSQSYSKNIRELQITKVPLVNDKFELFYKNFLNQIFHKIASKPYKSLPYIPILHYAKSIHRANHGTLNIMRQGLFTIKILQLFKKRNESLYNKIFKNKLLLKLVIIRSHFCSIVRVGEGIVGLTESKLIPIDITLIEKLFPNLNKKYHKIFTSEQKLTTSHSIYSAILFKTILLHSKNSVINDELIDYLSSMMLNYIRINDTGNNEAMKVKNLRFDSIGEIEKYYLLSILHFFGHNMDHCRGPWSDVMEMSFNKLFLNTINATYNDKIKYFDYVQKILLKTQLKGEPIQSKKCVPDNKISTKKNNSIQNTKKSKKDIISTKKCCTKLVSKGRYANKDFKVYSKDFDKLYRDLNFKKELELLIN